MTSYLMLAMRYFQQNRRRSLITVIGAAITVLILYTGLNLAYSFFLHIREAEREKQNYEFVLFAEDGIEVEEIIKDSRIKSAYVGSYYERHTETVYANALYINTANPYCIFPYGMAVVGVILSVLLLCGSIYFPLKGLENDLADGLKADC